MIQKGTPILITAKLLFSYISQEDMASRYITGFKKIGDHFKSEFRNEKDPSSNVYIGRNGDLMFKDFGDPNLPDALTIIQYVQYKYQLNYQSAINKIAYDFGLIRDIESSSKVVIERRNKIKKVTPPLPSDLIIRIKKRNWTKRDIEYWNSYYIPIKLLERNNIKSISHVFFDKYPPTEFSKDHLIFSYDYYWHEDIFRRKIYQPESKDYKWRTNTDWTVVQNYPNIPKKGGDILFIQSSYKDCMVMEMMGYWAIAPNKEGSWFPDYYWKKLKERWNKIIIFWDNDWEKKDNPGLGYSKKYSNRYNIPFILNPDGEPSDISDYVKKHGLDKGKQLVETLLKQVI